jgi:hypothetical protein
MDLILSVQWTNESEVSLLINLWRTKESSDNFLTIYIHSSLRIKLSVLVSILNKNVFQWMKHTSMHCQRVGSDLPILLIAQPKSLGISLESFLLLMLCIMSPLTHILNLTLFNFTSTVWYKPHHLSAGLFQQISEALFLSLVPWNLVIL